MTDREPERIPRITMGFVAVALFLLAAVCFLWGWGFHEAHEGPYWEATAPLWAAGFFCLILGIGMVWLALAGRSRSG